MWYCSANKFAHCPICLGCSVYKNPWKDGVECRTSVTSAHKPCAQETPGELCPNGPEQWICSCWPLFLPEFLTLSTNSSFLEFALEYISFYHLYPRQKWWSIVQLKHKSLEVLSRGAAHHRWGYFILYGKWYGPFGGPRNHVK